MEILDLEQESFKAKLRNPETWFKCLHCHVCIQGAVNFRHHKQTKHVYYQTNNSESSDYSADISETTSNSASESDSDDDQDNMEEEHLIPTLRYRPGPKSKKHMLLIGSNAEEKTISDIINKTFNPNASITALTALPEQLDSFVNLQKVEVEMPERANLEIISTAEPLSLQENNTTTNIIVNSYTDSIPVPPDSTHPESSSEADPIPEDHDLNPCVISNEPCVAEDIITDTTRETNEETTTTSGASLNRDQSPLPELAQSSIPEKSSDIFEPCSNHGGDTPALPLGTSLPSLIDQIQKECPTASDDPPPPQLPTPSTNQSSNLCSASTAAQPSSHRDLHLIKAAGVSKNYKTKKRKPGKPIPPRLRRSSEPVDHKGRSLTCRHCFSTFPNYDKLQIHLQTQHWSTSSKVNSSHTRKRFRNSSPRTNNSNNFYDSQNSYQNQNQGNGFPSEYDQCQSEMSYNRNEHHHSYHGYGNDNWNQSNWSESYHQNNNYNNQYANQIPISYQNQRREYPGSRNYSFNS